MWLLELALPIAALAAAIHQIRTDSRITRSFVGYSIVALIGYFAFCAIAVLIVFALRPRGQVSESEAATATGFVLLWIGYGAIWLTRLAPRLKEPPAWLMRPFAPLDWAIIGACTAMLAFLAMRWTGD
jgi:hypothetical protein